jgi:hypothetical protein
MARKASVAGQADKITCPACQCVVSSDGKTLHKKSEYLLDLVETDATVEQLEKAVGVLEKKLTQAQADLKTEKEKAAIPPKGKETHVDSVPQEKSGTTPAVKSGRKPWW